MSASLGCAALLAPLLAGILHGPVADAPAPAADEPVDVNAVITDAVQWLVDNQRDSGAWGSHQSPRPIEVLCGVPGGHHAFRVATTGLCTIALRDAGLPTEAARAALDRGIDYLLADANVKRQDGLEHYSVWSYGYALQALAEHLLATPDDPREREIRQTCRLMVKKLDIYQCLDGGWGYLSLDEVPTYRPSFTSMSFTTAACLVGLQRALEAGIPVPERVLARAVESVWRCRTPTGSYTYGEIWNTGPARGINQIKGAACRTPACQYAIERFGREVTEDEHVRSLDDLLVKHLRFQVASLRRPIPHESHYQISGYFYLFGCAYAGYVLAERSPEVQQRYAPELVHAVMVTHQPDGSFWDYPLYSYHKPYGTAYAVMALCRARAGLAGPVPSPAVTQD